MKEPSNESSEFYTYVYHDPERHVPTYVGKGCGKRSLFHLSRATNSQFRNRLRTLKRKNLEPLIEIRGGLTEEAAKTQEIALIKEHGRRDLGTGTLYNLTDGGEGSSGRILSEETKRKISSANSNPSLETRVKQGAWDRTADIRAKIGAANKLARINWTDEQRAAERTRRSVLALSPETRAKMSSSAKSRPALTCPHCQKIGKVPGIRRHHFEYCKFNTSK